MGKDKTKNPLVKLPHWFPPDYKVSPAALEAFGIGSPPGLHKPKPKK